MDWGSIIQPQPKQQVFGNAPPVMQLPPVEFAPPPQQQGPGAAAGVTSGISSIGSALLNRPKPKALDVKQQGDAPVRQKPRMTWDFPQGDMNV